MHHMETEAQHEWRRARKSHAVKAHDICINTRNCMHLAMHLNSHAKLAFVVANVGFSSFPAGPAAAAPAATAAAVAAFADVSVTAAMTASA